tara:strand:+ start:896 stop:1195 length:300 start_codon:yes stop_codon:yes gene_type:complete
MKSFSSVLTELNESRKDIPLNSFEVKRNFVEIGEQRFNVVFSSLKRDVKISIDGNTLNESFKSLKDAEKEFNNIRYVMKDLIEKDTKIEEIINEINIRV